MAKSRKPKRKASLFAAKGKEAFLAHVSAGRYEQALGIARKLIAGGLKHPNLYSDAATACIHLRIWPDAIKYARLAIALDPRHINAHDVLSHAHGALREWDSAARAGNRALRLRMEMMAATAPLDLPLAPAPEGADKKVIAFSLFGGNSKYCETAVLNCREQPRLYPGWTCRFHVDNSVPDVILERLRDAGGEVILIGEGMAHWPGPMWRFAAYDSPDAKYVIFRDADSVISEREAGAVGEWMASGKGFHAMRDGGTHTELLLAGLWGVVKGALPPMAALIETFLRQPPENAHFADQIFLRQFIWPFARQDILQHDSLFGFLEGCPFPEGPRRDDFHVGYAEGAPFITIKSDLPQGTELSWEIVDTPAQDGQIICRYPGKIENGALKAHVPARYATRIEAGEWRARLVRG